MENDLSDNDRQPSIMAASVRHSPPVADIGGQTLSDDSTKTEFHNLTVLDVVKLFEEAGVLRSLRSVVRWCKPNAQGERRLDSFLDPVSRKYFITPESAKQVIEEEKSKQQTSSVYKTTEENVSIPPASDDEEGNASERQITNRRIKELEGELSDSRTANKVKDIYVAQLQEDNKSLINELMLKSEKIGRLETRLQLEAPKENEKYNVIDVDGQEMQQIEK